MNRISHHTAAAALALQNAADLNAKPKAGDSATPQAGAQYNFAEIFGGADWGKTTQAAQTAKPAPIAAAPAHVVAPAIATATAKVVEPTMHRNSIHTATVSTAEEAAAATAEPVAAVAPAAEPAAVTATPAATAAATTPAAQPGVETLVSAIMNGSFQPTFVSDPTQLTEITPAGTDFMPGYYYATDQTASQLAQLLGGSVVKMPPFGQDKGWTEPMANFIQLPNGQTFNAADVAHYANAGYVGAAQLTADITGTINQGSAWTNYYRTGGPMPIFPQGYVGPPITGMTYPASMIGSDGNVINPYMQQSTVSGT